MTSLPSEPQENPVFDPSKASFWDQCILSWEKKRYQAPKAHQLLDQLKFLGKRSLRCRREHCLNMLTPILQGKKVLELGCGSGQMAGDLIERGARSYVGIDFASSAITLGKSKWQNQDKIQLICGDFKQKVEDAEVIFSLGLSDWLVEADVRELLALSQGKIFLHSFSMKVLGPGRLLHLGFSKLNYLPHYRPQYYTVDEIHKMAHESGLKSGFIYRRPELQFGCFLTNIR